jgi:hypothetical protein
MEFTVTVEKKQVVSGTITVKAKDGTEALEKIREKIESGELQTLDPKISWDDPEYIDFSFNATGDVD